MASVQSSDSMERISCEELAANWKTISRRVTGENIGFVITREGKENLVLCPASWVEEFLPK